jgi:hypothetical protein
MGRRLSLPIVVIMSVVFAALMSACSSGSSSSVSAPAAAPSSSQAPAQAAASTVSSSAQPPVPTVAAVPLVVCRTTFGITPPPAPKAQPTSVFVNVPGGSAAGLAVYTDDQGEMRLLGPRDWSCSAMYGADGSGGVVVSPPGEFVPSNWGAGWKLAADSSVQAIIGSQTSACMGCGEGQACPLFGTAAKDFRTNLGGPCPTSRPTAEITTQLSSGAIGFADPAGVAGDGIPSGGRYPANGVMTYYSGNQDGSWIETCTLPTASKDVCTTTLNYFLTSYGGR